MFSSTVSVDFENWFPITLKNNVQTENICGTGEKLQNSRTLCKLRGSKWNELAALCPWVVASKELDLEVSVGPLG